MKVVLQRVKRASVTVEGAEKAAIGAGFLLLVGIGHNDTPDVAMGMAAKILKLRVFGDEKGMMNLALGDVRGEVLSVPQFTLLGSTDRGCRPGFDAAAPAREAEVLWKEFNRAIRDEGIHVEEGIFGAHMEIGILNDGPVTFVLDKSDKKGREMSIITVVKPDTSKLEDLGVAGWPIWQKEVSSFDWSYDTGEVCYILEGRAIVEPRDGEPVEFASGDLVTFPAGMECVWKITEPIKKHYRMG